MSSVKESGGEAGGKGVEESVPLIDSSSSNPSILASSKNPSKSNLSKHRSVDQAASLDQNGGDKPQKQILFRTASHQPQQLSVHYQTDSVNGESDQVSIPTIDYSELNEEKNGSNRFKVDKVSDESSDDVNNSSDEDGTFRAAQAYGPSYDTKNIKSFKHYTREALPKIDHYRNVMSVHGHMARPTLDELHGVQTTVSFDKGKSHVQSKPADDIDLSKVVKFGWVQGVLVRCLLNIWGVMLFLRLSWVAGQAGIILGTAILLLASLVTVLTTMSMSAICTNGEVKGGGTYYMISRSLGPEFGGSIGIIFSLANAVAVAMYTVGFSETLRDMLLTMGKTIFDGGLNDIRLISCITVTILLSIAYIGTEWESKTQIVLLFILLTAMGDFLIGTCISPTDDQISRGYIGWSTSLMWENMGPAYRNEDFFSVFSVYFPAATGILAGANISGDLKNPSYSIPLGTFLAIIITTISYVGFLVIVAMNVVRDANGVVELVNHPGVKDVTLAIRNCSLAPTHTCAYGTMNNFQIIELMAWYGPIIYAGIYAATLSSALASLVSAPKVFQALCNDKLFPGIAYFGKGFGINNEPRRGYLLTFAIAFGCCLIGELNAIAPIISNFFLAAYGLINFSCFHASFVKSPGFRPGFKYYNKWVALLGSILCLGVMFITSWFTALLTFIIVFALYIWVQQRQPDVNWGSSMQAEIFKSAINSVYKLNLLPDHVKTYRPQILLLSGNPAIRPDMVDLSHLITKGIGLLFCGNVVNGQMSNRSQNAHMQEANLWLLKRGIKGFCSIVVEPSMSAGVRAMLQSTGIGKLKPNIVMLGFKTDWKQCEAHEVLDYFRTIHIIFDKHISIVIMHLPNGNSVANGDANKAVSINMKDSEKAVVQSSKIASESKVPVDSLFLSKQKKGCIDVWWLYDDGGLTLLLPYIIRTHNQWKDCKLRVFALVNKKTELDTEQRNMAALLSKFRIDYSDVILITDILKPPQESSKQEFHKLIEKYIVDESSDEQDKAGKKKQEHLSDLEQLQITENDVETYRDKTYRHIRLREILLHYSKNSKLIVMTLPMPRKNQCPPVLYMAWLETLTRDMPPMMMMRGNQTNVLTFYS